MKIFCAVLAAFYIWLVWDDLALSKEYKTFCKSYMVWVNQYPTALHAGCCEIDHPSNDLLKKGYKGEPLLICDWKKHYAEYGL